jgi:putative metallohydrolase (TIGR04338 family)
VRDSQRQKLYDAEDAIFDPHWERLRFATLEDAQALVDAVCASAMVRERYPRAEKVPTVKRAHGRRRGACYSPLATAIELDQATQTKNVTLHELAHHFVRPSSRKGVAAHGREFAECFLWLVRVYIGRSWAQELEASFKAYRVAYKPKRAYSISDAERERRRAQGQRLAAARR